MASEKIICINASNGIYISTNIEGKSYHSSNAGTWYFDGELPTKTHRPDWWKILKIPTKVQKMGSTQYENIRWELKKGYPISDLTPEVLLENPNDDESNFYAVCGLYERKYETVEGILEDIDFELVLVGGGKFIKEEFKVQYGLLDQIEVLPAMLPNKPCSISGEDMYKLIRNRVKCEIDGNFARVTSDYDFCFTIQKIIKLSEPLPYQVIAGTKRKPITVTKYRHERNIVIFESAPKPYNKYPVQKGITANNYEELETKIEEYLSNLIQEINKPLVDCAHCSGLGVLDVQKVKTL